MRDKIRFVGLDVHKDSIAIALAEEGGAEPEILATIPNELTILLKHLKRLGPASSLRCCYEAGPPGYSLYRELSRRGISCVVVAPSLVPVQAGKPPESRFLPDALDVFRPISISLSTAGVSDVQENGSFEFDGTGSRLNFPAQFGRALPMSQCPLQGTDGGRPPLWAASCGSPSLIRSVCRHP